MHQDQELAKQYAGGDDEAFVQLWRIHHASLYRQARRCGHEDLAQEATARLCSRLLQPQVRKSYSGRGSWRQWSGSILAAILADMFRRLAAERRALAALAESADTHREEPVAPWQWQQLRADVKACLAELPDKLRTLIFEHH